ncbi:TonB-dependent receptor (plasmid) [Sphingomonas paeninsulae]|uniref:TonB-dependent receptor n=1 Tax=Sphingomonas paeninsulae TaxID=2319844 RepID=A0A494TJE2_SPHPE|nr:TonB-dependent receptor [Sphingomonas paeninsulae]AYJ85255.1 TonB-dependent receptor [Sphingomonas paeninsulae]
MTNRIFTSAAQTLATASLIAMPTAAHAQTPPAAPAPVDQTAQAAGPGLDEIVVTAQRREQRLQDVPLTITAVSADTLSKAGVTTLRDVQNIVSGFTFSGQGTVAQPSIRGVSTLLSTSGSENPNALYIDGIYQATQAALGNELPDIERIEVLKGPQGTLFGRNATGGAIQIFTRAPSFKPTASFALDAGYYTGNGGSHSAERVSARAFVSGPIISDVVAASISGGYTYTPGYWTDDRTGNQSAPIRKVNGRAKLLIVPSDKVDITLGAYYVDNNESVPQTPVNGLSAAGAYPGAVVPTQPWHTAHEDDPLGADKALLKQYGFSAQVKVDTGFGTLTSLTGYNNTKALNPATSIAGAYGTLPCSFNFACLDYYFAVSNREISQELNFASEKMGILSFVTGLYYYNAKGATVGKIQNDLAPFAPPGTFPITVQQFAFQTKSYAAYGEATIQPSDPLSFILGLRFSHEPHEDVSTIPVSPVLQKTFNSLTPRVSARYELTNALNVYGTFSIGFKSGLTGASNNASVPQFAPVQPEKIYSYEAGVKYATAGLTFNGSFFYYDYRNKQEQTFTGLATIVTNTGPVRIFGFDFDTSAKLADHVTFRGTASWIPVAKYLDFPNASGSSTTRIPFDTTMPPFNCAPGGGCGSFEPIVFNASGLRLSRTPKVTASGTLTYDDGKFDASGTVSFSSSVFHDITGIIRQPAYAIFTAQAGYKIDGVRIGIYGRNIGNKAYIVNGLSSSAGFLAGYAPPREVGLSLGFNY